MGACASYNSAWAYKIRTSAVLGLCRAGEELYKQRVPSMAECRRAAQDCVAVHTAAPAPTTRLSFHLSPDTNISIGRPPPPVDLQPVLRSFYIVQQLSAGDRRADHPPRPYSPSASSSIYFSCWLHLLISLFCHFLAEDRRARPSPPPSLFSHTYPFFLSFITSSLPSFFLGLGLGGGTLPAPLFFQPYSLFFFFYFTCFLSSSSILSASSSIYPSLSSFLSSSCLFF